MGTSLGVSIVDMSGQFFSQSYSYSSFSSNGGEPQVTGSAQRVQGNFDESGRPVITQNETRHLGDEDSGNNRIEDSGERFQEIEGPEVEEVSSSENQQQR